MAADRQESVAARRPRSVIEEARYTARVLAGPAGNTPPVVLALTDLADAHEKAQAVLGEIAVGVVLAEDVSVETQLAALWRVVRHHSKIAREALDAAS